MRQNRSSLILGILLILFGAWLVITRQVPAVQDWLENNFTWPMWTIGAGLLILLIGLITGTPGMAVPASIVAGIGGILYYQNETGNFASWAYMWALIPGFVGVGVILAGLLGENTRANLVRGLNLIAISAVLFLVFGTFFGGLAVLGDYGAAILLILLGLYILARGFVPDYSQLYRLLGLKWAEARGGPVTAAIPSAGFGVGDSVGSNAWVLAGTRTTSGRPLLANDPHLGLTTPSLWYFAALSAPGLNVIGATLPGVPGVVLGRNDRVAWSFTNTGADQLDLYLERVKPEEPDQYQTPDGWAPFEESRERIRVKGGTDVELVVRRTRNGPVMSGLASFDRVLPPGPYVLALRWSALAHDDRTMTAIRALNKARDIDAAERALESFDLVTQSVLLADVEGQIGLVVTGRVPLRRSDNDLHGIAPAPGWEPRYGWVGYLPQAAKTRLRNPGDGAIVTANHKLGDAPYPHHLTYDWFRPYRADRIAQRLAEQSLHDAASMRAIQSDVVSLAALDLLAQLGQTQPATAAGQDALARLQRWDGAMHREAAEPLLFHAWMRKLKHRIFADDFGPRADTYIDAAEVTSALRLVLSGQAGARDWCDDRTTPHRFETCSALAADALDAAVEELTRTTGLDVAGLRWGAVHQAVGPHRPLSAVRALAWLFEQRIEYPGDTYTINAGALTHDAAAPFTTRHAASLRAVYDLAALATGSSWIHSSGQSGSPFSPHFASMLVHWRDVEYFPMRAATPVEATVLELVPRAR